MRKIYIFTMLAMSLLSTFSICAQPVARINTNTYSTLSDAFSAVSSGDTIHLLSNIICTEGIVVDHGGTFVFDGNGHTIMADFPANNYTLFSITSDVNMTMQNLSIMASSSVEGTLVELADSAGATLHVTNCDMTGYTLFQNYKTNTLVLSENNCTAEYDVVEYNDEGSTVTFKSGHYSANTYAIVDYNYGTTIIEDGTYETVDDIVYENDYRLYIQGGTFTSDDNFVAYCEDGYTEVSNVNVTCQYEVFYKISGPASLVIRSGTFNSDNYCINNIRGNVIVYGGDFNAATEYVAFIDNGFLHIAGPATFNATNGSAGVFNDITKVGISCQYEFVPSISNPYHTASVEKTPVTLNFYVGTDIYMSESAFPGCSSVNLPELPAGYPYWVDYFGRRVYRIGEITGDADYFAYKEPDSVSVTFIDGLDTTVVTVLNHTTLGDIAHFSSITDPSFYGWRDADLVTYAADYELTANRILYAYYLPDGEVVCTFAELQAAVLAQKPVIKLCAMIEVPSTLEITANTLITGTGPDCGLLRPEGFAGNLIYVFSYDTLSITLQGITIDGQNVAATEPAVYMRDYYRRFAVYNELGQRIRYDYEYGCSELNILDCEFRNNNNNNYEASALYSECFKTVICNSLFENNQGRGSTIKLSYGNVNDTYTSIIRNSRILHNVGTGIEAFRQDTVEIFDSQISYNNAGPNGDGGGIDLSGTDVVILRGTTTISYNTARHGGGCYAWEVGRLIMRESSKITHNTAEDGGGVDCDELDLEMYDNSEISFNSAISDDPRWGRGGGIYFGWGDRPHVIADNAAIFGNYASGHGGGIYNNNEELDFRGGVIYGNRADGGGHDFYGDVWDRDRYINFQMTFPPRTIASDTTGIQTIWVDEIPGVTAPGYVHVPFAGWFTDEETERFTDFFSGHEAILTYLTYRNAYAKTVWYGLLLDYNSNNPSAIDFIDSTAYAPHSEAPVADNMFSYPGYKFLGWNTQADGSGDEYLPNDTLPFDVHSVVLYAQWCLILHDTILVDACSSYEWNGVTYTESDTVDFLTTAVGGCDSIATLILTISLPVEQNDTLTICSSELPYTWRDTTFLAGTVSGDYALLRQTIDGCDSTMNLHLTVKQSYSVTDTMVICNGMLPYIWNGVTFNAAGTQTAILSSADLCDSVVTMTLIIGNISISVESINNGMCGGEASITLSSTGEAPVEYSLDGIVFQSSNVFSGLASGSYTVTARDANGCTATTTAVISPVLTPSLTFTCPPDIRDTLAYGDCAMKIYPAELGTPTAVHSLGWPFSITNNAPADSLYPAGDNIVTWIMTDSVCGFAVTCYQHILVVFPECPDAVDCEGNVYAGVRIGCDCWTQRNLESTKYSDCTDIPCVYEYVSHEHPNVTENVERYGRLYCFEAAVRDSADNGHGHIQGICPAGWYLPTPEKYEELNTYGAEALKSPLYWIPSGGNNSTEFSALPAGFYSGIANRFEGMLGETYFWSTSNTGSGTSSSAYSLFLNCEYFLHIQNNYGSGYSVRCIKEKE